MTYNKNLLYLLLSLVATLSGCTPLEREQTPTEVPVPATESSKSWGPVPLATPTAKHVSIPDSAQWLTEHLEVKYGPIPASLALKQLVPGGVLRFAFALEEDPSVSQPLGAITRMDHINAVCMQANWAWQVHQGVVTVTDMETRSFTIQAPPGQSVNQLGTSPDTTSQSQLNYFSDAYTELYEAVKGVLALNEAGAADGGGSRGRLSLLGASGQLLARAPPATMRVIAQLVGEYNQRINRRVALEFVLYEVDVTETDTRHLDLSAIRDAAISSGIFFQGSNFNSGSNAGELSLRFKTGSSRLGGSELILNWLKTQGETSIRLRKKVVALHNQVTLLRDVETTRYVVKVAVERQVSGPNETSSPSVEVNELQTGESWAVLPAIDAERVHLRLALNRAALLGFDEYSFDAGNISGRLPQSTEKSVGLPITLADGETRLITNLSSTITQSSRARSPLLAWLPWLGQSKDDQERRVESVITMTAHIL